MKKVKMKTSRRKWCAQILFAGLVRLLPRYQHLVNICENMRSRPAHWLMTAVSFLPLRRVFAYLADCVCICVRAYVHCVCCV